MQVLIFERSEQIICRLEEILSETGNISTILKAVSFEEAIEHFRLHYPEAVIIDCGLNKKQIVDLLQEISHSQKQTLIIALVDQYDDLILNFCEENDVDVVIDKYREFEKLPSIINCIGV
jgi:DNA-binding NarL/FixJ family response regulator